MCGIAEREEIKIVWVFEHLFGEIGLRRRQGALKVGDGFAFAFVQLCFNVVREHRAGPAVFDGLVSIPEPDGGGVQLGQKQAVSCIQGQNPLGGVFKGGTPLARNGCRGPRP